jgi:hypothetical protein
MKQSEWVRIVGLWASLWPHRPLPPESVEPWYLLLYDLDGDVVKVGLLGWAADPDRSWPPQSPGELRDAVLEPVSDWTEAITELSVAVRRTGSYGGRPPLPPLLDAYVDSVGGWVRLCSTFDAADPTIRAQFRDYWRDAARRVRRAAALELAAGAIIGEALSGALNPGGGARGLPQRSG